MNNDVDDCDRFIEKIIKESDFVLEKASPQEVLDKIENMDKATDSLLD